MAVLLKLIRPMAVWLSTVVLVGALVALAVDSASGIRHADALAARMQTAEQAALQDPAAHATLEAEVAAQTSSSLTRQSRQRVAAILALAAGSLCLILLKSGHQSPPTWPGIVAQAVARRTAVSLGSNTCERESVSAAAVSAPDVDLAVVESLVKRIGCESRHLIPLLHALNEHYHYLPSPALGRLAELTEVAYPQIVGVASFYTQFRTRPRGQHTVEVCRGTACHVSGADRIREEMRRLLRIPADGDTDANGIATVETVGCLGCCTLAPVIRVDGRIEGHADVTTLPTSMAWDRACRLLPGDDGSTAPASPPAADGNGISFKLVPAQPLAEIRVGLGSCCVAGGSRDVMVRLQHEIAAQRLHACIRPVGCVGICHLTPFVEVVIPGTESIVATRVTPADVPQLVTRDYQGHYTGHVAGATGGPICGGRETSPSGPDSPCHIGSRSDTRIRAFSDRQIRIVTEHSGLIDPTSLEQYRAHDGFVAWEKCLREQSPQAIIQAIEQSGLRGRGGAGYPTAAKWQKLYASAGEKFLVCNGDEGDPGAFMDRMIMESYPYRVLEGMAIAAYAVGTQHAFLYVRHEYPLAVRRLRHAVDRMTAAGLLGDQLMGTTFSLQVEVVEGAGAFVCGEETALLQSMMGHRGSPRLRPPYPAERGLFDRPTLVNNVETFANVPWILRNGPDRFSAVGTATSRGTKVFSLAGKIRRGGLIEIPLGLTIRQVVEDIGGGVADGKRFKAVQIGGPSGGCVPAELADTPIDYEHLQHVGAILGSGGLVVLDNDDCMVDVARYFLEFTQHESCGHCTFCRVGTRKLLDILERLCTGKGRPNDLDEIETLSHAVSLGSLCGLGKTAPNPVLSTLKYFREEYEAHLQGRCPAGRCKSLIRYDVTRDCVGCTLCAQHCPMGAITATPYRQHMIDAEVCTRCDACRVRCPEQAIQVV